MSNSKYDLILSLSSEFENKLVKYSAPLGKNVRAQARGHVTIPEVTVVGDPNAPEQQKQQEQQQEQPQDQDLGEIGSAKGPKEVFQEAGWNWEPKIYYNPTQQKDKDILIQKGFKLIPGVGLVPPNEIGFVTKALSSGWKYAGGGFGLVPAQWYDYLKREHYI